jgi:hypothetical protein
MITSTYTIAFNFPVEDSRLVVPLTADVNVHHSEIFYVISNFRTGSDRKTSVLPDITIKKKNGRWVHLDSEKESHLSAEVGKHIEAVEMESELNSKKYCKGESVPKATTNETTS